MGAQSENISSPSWLDRTLFPFQSRRVRILDHEIHFVDEGRGPTLLLLHGNGSWIFGFRLVLPALSSHFRVIALDYAGFGLSVAAPGFSFKPRDHSNVVEAFIDSLKLRDIRLVVEDWGGPVGLGVAGRRPDLFHSLVISNTWAWSAQDSPQLRRFSTITGSFLGRFLITQFNILERILVPNVLIARRMSPAEVQGYHMPYPTPQSRIPQAIFPREILASSEFLLEVEVNLKQLATKSVLIIWGELDQGFRESERKRFLNHFGNARVVLLPQAKHFVHVDEPDRTVNATLAFERHEGCLEVN